MVPKLNLSSKLLFAGRRVLNGNRQQRLASADLVRSYRAPPPYGYEFPPPPGPKEGMLERILRSYTPLEYALYLVILPFGILPKLDEHLKERRRTSYDRGYNQGLHDAYSRRPRGDDKE